MPPEPRRDGPVYHVLPDEVQSFRRDGYVHLAGVLSELEVAEIEAVYERFLSREIEVTGRDFCDMSGDYTRDVADFSIINVMLPRRYYPPWQGNVYEQRVGSIATQLCGADLVLDYDQLLAKPPGKADGVFPWHQDMAYWVDTPDTRTATAWLALDDTSVDNGCMRFVPGSHLEPLRRHQPLLDDRGKSHALVAAVDDARDVVRPVPIRRGDVTVHGERVLHGSGGNRSAGWRRAYVVAFRARVTVEEERRRGFTHSHNDELGVLDDVGVEGETRRGDGATS